MTANNRFTAVNRSRLRRRFRQRARQPEGAEHAIVESGNLADEVPGQGQDDDAEGPPHAGSGITDVDRAGGLAVGPGEHEPLLTASRRADRREEPGDSVAAL